MQHPSDGRPVPQIVAFMLAIAAGVILLLVPGHIEVTQTNDGPEQARALTLLEAEGPSILVPLLIPVALTGLPLLLPGRARKGASIATTAALAIFTVAGAASIGWFYLPATIAAIIALFSVSQKGVAPQPRPATGR